VRIRRTRRKSKVRSGRKRKLILKGEKYFTSVKRCQSTKEEKDMVNFKRKAGNNKEEEEKTTKKEEKNEGEKYWKTFSSL
jgi:hypothetical protein